MSTAKPGEAGEAGRLSRLSLEDTRRFWSKVDKSGDCWVWTGATSGVGYGGFWAGGKARNGGRTLRAHRVAYEVAKEPIPRGMFVCHSCDTPLCVNPAHLFLGTHTDNMRDRGVKGRVRGQRPGEGNTSARLANSDVPEIRSLASSGVSNSAIAIKYGVTRNTVANVVARRSWRHVP